MINPSLNVIASWAVAVAQALDVRGVDSTAIFSAAGIDLATARDPGMESIGSMLRKGFDGQMMTAASS